jgi:hypothetical protein
VFVDIDDRVSDHDNRNIVISFVFCLNGGVHNYNVENISKRKQAKRNAKSRVAFEK